MGQGGCNLNYTPRRRNTHKPTNSQPSHRPPAPIPPLYHPSHLGQKPSGSKMNKPPKQGKKTGKEGETLNSRKRREENQEKRYATRTPRHANKAPSTTQTQPRHMTCARAKATYRWTGICPPPPSCSRTIINATNANIFTQQRYRRPTRHQRTPKILETIAFSR